MNGLEFGPKFPCSDSSEQMQETKIGNFVYYKVTMSMVVVLTIIAMVTMVAMVITMVALVTWYSSHDNYGSHNN